jgi:hypothetical protein
MPKIPTELIKDSSKLNALQPETVKKPTPKPAEKPKSGLPPVPPPPAMEPVQPTQIEAKIEEKETIAVITEDTNTPAPQDSLLLSDEFAPPSVDGKHPIIAKPGYVVTPVMATPGAMALYSRNDVVYLKYQDAPNYIENMSMITRGPDGMARYADCVLAVETQKHCDARMAYVAKKREAEKNNTLREGRNEMVSRIDTRGFGDVVTSPQASIKIE